MWGYILVLGVVGFIVTFFMMSDFEEKSYSISNFTPVVLVISVVAMMLASINLFYGYPVDRKYLSNSGYEVLYYNSEIPEVILLWDTNGNCRLSQFYPEIDEISGSKFVKLEDSKIVPWNTTSIGASAPADSQ